jgi:cardiolipin synthase
MLRMALAPVFVVLAVQGDLKTAAIVFVVAAITDALDGLLARFGSQRTELGAILDPLADKILLGSAFVALTWADAVLVRLPKWLTILVLARDGILLISSLAIAVAEGRRTFPPSLLGKATTATQLSCGALVVIANVASVPAGFLEAFFVAAGALTVGSGAHYLYRASSKKIAAREQA